MLEELKMRCGQLQGGEIRIVVGSRLLTLERFGHSSANIIRQDNLSRFGIFEPLSVMTIHQPSTKHVTIVSKDACNGSTNDINRPSMFIRCPFAFSSPVNNTDISHPSSEWRRCIHPAMQTPRFPLLRQMGQL